MAIRGGIANRTLLIVARGISSRTKYSDCFSEFASCQQDKKTLGQLTEKKRL